MSGSATIEELQSIVEDWVNDRCLDGEEEVASAIAETNSIFSEQYCEDVELEFEERGRYLFTATVSMPHSEPRRDDVPFSPSDQIDVRIEGVLAFDEDAEEWEIEEYYISAAVQRYDDDADYDIEPQERKPLPTADIIIKKLSDLRRGMWCRGHSDADWPLCTSIGRINDPDISKERELRKEFERRIAFLDHVKYPMPQAELFFLMQHHGIPTRLLDWTTNPLVALYFALSDETQIDKDACIWVMDPGQLNRSFKEDYPAEVKEKLFAEVDEKKVLAIRAAHTNTRMTSQRAEFTIHMNYTPLDRIKEASVALEEKIMIPSFLKAELKEKLRALGVDRSSLFPDLDNIAKTVIEDVLGE